VNSVLTDLTVVKRKPDQVSCDLSGEAVILNLNSGMYYGIDEIGQLIWNALEEPRSLQYLRDAIVRDYEVEPETCERDVKAFLAEMQSAGLIEITNEAVA
jgi:hypothetical protein